MKILSLDGGGLRGVGQAAILGQVPDLDRFDMVVGTSVGSILASLVAIKAPQNVFVDFFRRQGMDIFRGYWWRRFKFLGSRYDDAILNKHLKKLFPYKLRDATVPLFVVAGDFKENRLKVFSSVDPKFQDTDWNMWEVVRASVAAPTYFSPWRGYIDGGVYANNPSVVGIVAAVKDLKARMEDIEVCSIGTGEIFPNARSATGFLTSLQWGDYLVHAMLDGAAMTMHDMAARTFAEYGAIKSYLRIQFPNPCDFQIDDPAVVEGLLDLWRPNIMEGVLMVKDFLKP